MMTTVMSIQIVKIYLVEQNDENNGYDNDERFCIHTKLYLPYGCSKSKKIKIKDSIKHLDGHNINYVQYKRCYNILIFKTVYVE